MNLDNISINADCLAYIKESRPEWIFLQIDVGPFLTIKFCGRNVANVCVRVSVWNARENKKVSAKNLFINHLANLCNFWKSF